MGSDYLAMLLADARLPSGSHTQSAGLEPALLAGLRLAEVPEFIEARLHTITRSEAAAAVVAAHVVRDGLGELALREVNQAWLARTPVEAVRDASLLAARGYLRLFAALELTPPRGPGWCRPVIVGALAGRLGLTAPQTARVVAFEDVQTVIAAALKLEPFDPALGLAWARAAEPAVARLVEDVAPLTRPEELPARSAPLIDQWCHQHSFAERRLFRA